MSPTSIFMISFFAVLVLGIVIFDVYIIKKKGKPASISAYIIRGSKEYPLLVLLFGLALGIVFGHLFWSMRTQDYLLPEDFKKECLIFLQENEDAI